MRTLTKRKIRVIAIIVILTLVVIGLCFVIPGPLEGAWKGLPFVRFPDGLACVRIQAESVYLVNVDSDEMAPSAMTSGYATPIARIRSETNPCVVESVSGEKLGVVVPKLGCMYFFGNEGELEAVGWRTWTGRKGRSKEIDIPN